MPSAQNSSESHADWNSHRPRPDLPDAHTLGLPYLDVIAAAEDAPTHRSAERPLKPQKSLRAFSVNGAGIGETIDLCTPGRVEIRAGFTGGGVEIIEGAQVRSVYQAARCFRNAGSA
jgi:hypothetical protein